MKRITAHFIPLFFVIFLTGCAGIKYMSIETREPAQVALPANIRSVLVVNNTVPQPSDLGHKIQRLGKKNTERLEVSSDSAAIFYTEALAQFIDEEGYFDAAKHYAQSLRSDKNFGEERPLTPEKMNELRQASNTDAVISLDRLLIQTDQTDLFVQEGYRYAAMTGKLLSTIRVYLPSMEGKIPTIQFSDSLKWDGFDIDNDVAYAERILPSTHDAVKELTVYAAEKMTKVFSPHWEFQERWYYTSMKSAMKEGEVLAKNRQWAQALDKWKQHFDREKRALSKARAAHNIALAYEMLDDMDSARKWAQTAADLFITSTPQGSLERKRSDIYMKEIERRSDVSNKLDMN